MAQRTLVIREENLRDSQGTEIKWHVTYKCLFHLAGESVQTIAPGGVESDVRAVTPVLFKTGYRRGERCTVRQPLRWGLSPIYSWVLTTQHIHEEAIWGCGENYPKDYRNSAYRSHKVRIISIPKAECKTL